MPDHKRDPSGAAKIGAYEAKTKFSELIARAEQGESFVVTKNGRPVAKITSPATFNREKVQQAADWIRARLAQGPRVSEEEAQRNYEEHKADMEREWDERMDRWLKS